MLVFLGKRKVLM